ncbi:MAG: hypothetical protein CML39_09075 [Rhodobacteraceae bacterium]|nr:MAG: hypothetical protein CML39_09075 [Paracoccaceae bacterium]
MTIYRIFILITYVIISSCQSIDNNSRYKNSNNKTFSDHSIMERPLPDNRGVITYQDYQIIVANGSETVAGIAGRLGIEPKKLASYNGVLMTYLPRKDEVIALPVMIPGDLVSTSAGWNQESARKTIANSLENSSRKIGTPDNPLRHRIEPGETAYSIARLYNVSVTSLAKWNGLDTDLSLTAGRELIIPVLSLSSGSSSSSSAQARANSNSDNNKPKNPPDNDEREKKSIANDSTSGENTELTTHNTSIKENSNATESKIITKPYVRPVDGKILRGFNPTASSNKNEGIDFHAPPGSSIKAVADGVVALISKPVGGLGKIVLIKHDMSVISIYGRVKDLKVSKGSRVLQGQIIGKVEKSSLDESDTKENYLHFELRKGTKSLDPLPLFQ